MNSSINIFTDEYHNDRSPKPTAKKFIINDNEIIYNNQPMAGRKTKYKVAEIFKGHQEPTIHMKKKLFPDKIQTIFGGSSK